MMPKLPEPDTMRRVRDASCPSCHTLVRIDSPGYTPESVRAIQEEAYRAGMAAAVPDELMALFNFMCAAFVPMTGQQDQIKIQLDLAKKAMAARVK